MRTVKVGLEADVKGFVEPVKSAKDSVDGLKDKTEALDRSIDKIAPDAAKAGAGLKVVGEEAERAKVKVDGLKDKVEGLDDQLDKIPRDASKAAAALALLKGDVSELNHSFNAVGDRSTALSVLGARIRATRDEVEKLGNQFAKTGDMDVFKKLGQAQGNLTALVEFRKKMSTSTKDGVEEGLKKAVSDGGAEAASTFSQLFEGGIINAFKNPYVAAAAGVLVAGIAPLLGSAIGGAIIGAGAGGAVALGIAGAAQADPKRIGAAWDAEIARIKKQWLDASQSFVQPTINAIHTLGAETSKIHLDTMLAKAATFVDPLAKGVAGFEGGIARGVEALVNKAGPVIEVLKQELPQVGHAVEMSLSMIAGGNKGAADGLRDILHALEAVIVGTGAVVRGAEDIYHAFKEVGEAIRGVTDYLPVAKQLTDVFAPDQPKAYAVSLDGATHGMDKFASATEEAKARADELKQKVSDIDQAFSNVGKSAESEFTSKLLKQMFALDDATLGFQESLNKLDDAVKKNGTSLDIHTDAGLKNAKALESAAKANAELYEQNLLSGMSANEAAAKYKMGTDELYRQAAAAGFNSKEVQGLIGKYANIPERVQTLIATIGLTDALNHLGQILTDFRLLNDKEFRTKYTITTTYITRTGTVGGKEGPGLYAQGGIRHAAVGMVIPPTNPGWVLAGEPQTGGEALIPLRGISQARAMDLSRTVGNAYNFDVGPRGGGAMKFQHTFNVAGNADSGLATWLMKAFRNGDVQVTSRAIVN